MGRDNRDRRAEAIIRSLFAQRDRLNAPFLVPCPSDLSAMLPPAIADKTQPAAETRIHAWSITAMSLVEPSGVFLDEESFFDLAGSTAARHGQFGLSIEERESGNRCLRWRDLPVYSVQGPRMCVLNLRLKDGRAGGSHGL